MSKKENVFCSHNDLLFAERIRLSRENAGIKQFELAKMANITPATLSAYELFSADSTDSKGKKPSLHNAIELAKALNISLDWLCGLSDEIQVPDSRLITDLIDSKQQYGDADFFIDFLRPTEEVFKILRSYAESFTQYPIQPEEDYSDVIATREQRMSEEAMTITIRNPRVIKFFKGWVSMYKNYTEGIIDKEVFDLWLKKSMEEVDTQQTKDAASNNISNYRMNNIGEILTYNEGDESIG